MGGVVSGALHLVSPLAAVTAPPIATPVTVSAGAALPRAGLPATPAVDWSGLVQSFHEVIAADVRRELTEGGVTPVPVPDGSGVDDAVLAEHDARIAFLQQRLADGRSRGTLVPAQITDLQARLRRAEAARGVAMSRVDPSPGDWERGNALVAWRPVPGTDAARPAPRTQKAVTIARLSTPAHPRPFLAEAPGRRLWRDGAHRPYVTLAHASARPAHGLISTKRATAGLSLHAPRLPRHAAGERLTHHGGIKALRDARRLLAAARLALAGAHTAIPLT